MKFIKVMWENSLYSQANGFDAEKFEGIILVRCKHAGHKQLEVKRINWQINPYEEPFIFFPVFVYKPGVEYSIHKVANRTVIHGDNTNLIFNTRYLLVKEGVSVVNNVPNLQLKVIEVY